MKKNTHFIVPASDFFLDAGEDNLSEYRFGTGVARHRFCSEVWGPGVLPSPIESGRRRGDCSLFGSGNRVFGGGAQVRWDGLGASYAATGIAACSRRLNVFVLY